MTWFKHHHWWRELHGMKRTHLQKPPGFLILEHCDGCGVVRSIEVRTGAPPIIRMGVETHAKREGPT